YPCGRSGVPIYLQREAAALYQHDTTVLNFRLLRFASSHPRRSPPRADIHPGRCGPRPFGVGSTWFGLRAVAALVRETTDLRARGLWTLLRAWLQPLGCTSIGVGFVLLGAAALWFSYVTTTTAPVYAPPIVWVITEVALVLRDVATVLGGCGMVL